MVQIDPSILVVVLMVAVAAVTSQVLDVNESLVQTTPDSLVNETCGVIYSTKVIRCLQSEDPETTVITDLFTNQSTVLSDDEADIICGLQSAMLNCTTHYYPTYPDKCATSNVGISEISISIDALYKKVFIGCVQSNGCNNTLHPSCLHMAISNGVEPSSEDTAMSIGDTLGQTANFCRDQEEMLECLYDKHSGCLHLVPDLKDQLELLQEETNSLCNNIYTNSRNWYACFRAIPASVVACDEDNNTTYNNIELSSQVDMITAICRIKESSLSCRKIAWENETFNGTDGDVCRTSGMKLWVKEECRRLPFECFDVRYSRILHVCNGTEKITTRSPTTAPPNTTQPNTTQPTTTLDYYYDITDTSSGQVTSVTDLLFLVVLMGFVGTF